MQRRPYQVPYHRPIGGGSRPGNARSFPVPRSGAAPTMAAFGPPGRSRESIADNIRDRRSLRHGVVVVQAHARELDDAGGPAQRVARWHVPPVETSGAGSVQL